MCGDEPLLLMAQVLQCESGKYDRKVMPDRDPIGRGVVRER